jgi:hypothetical protein
MAKLGINTGTSPNDGTGDTLLSAALKINQNFTEIYSAIGSGTTITNSIGYAVTAGLSTYSASAGIATVAQGLTGTPNIIVGTTTATSFVKSGGISSQFLKADGSVDSSLYLTTTGNGSLLTGIVTSIVAGTNVTISGSTGEVTINATGGGGGESYWSSTSAGIHTTSNVGIGTTNPTSALTVGGGTSTRELYVTGVSTFSNSLDIFGGISFKTPTDANIFSISYESNNDDISFNWQQSGGTGGSQILWYIPETSSFVMRNPAIDEKLAQFTTGGSVELYYDGSKKFETIGAGVTVTGTIFTNQLNVSGVSTFQNDIKVAEYSYGTNSNQITLGNNKFRIYSDSSNTYLKNYDSNIGGDLYIESDEILIRKYDGTETIAQFTEGAGVKLNYQGATKLQTTNNGILVGGITLTDQLIVSGVSTLSTLNVGTGSSIIHTNSYGVGIGTTADTSAFVVGGGPDKLLVRGRIRSFGPYSAEEGTLNGISVGSDRETIKGLLIYDDGTTPGGIVEKGVKLTAIDESLELNAGVGANYNRIIINQNGVGIGTTNPTSALTVKGNTSIETLGVSGVSTFQAFNSYVEIGSPGYYAGLRLISGGTEARVEQSGAGDLRLTSYTNRDITLNSYSIFGDSNNSGNVQLNNGNVGITKVGSAITFTANTGNIQAASLSVSGVSTFQNNVYLGDSDVLNFGDSNDLQISHNPGVTPYNFINGGTTVLTIRSGDIDIQSGSQNYTSFSANNTDTRISWAGTNSNAQRVKVDQTSVELYTDVKVLPIGSASAKFSVGTGGTVITTTSDGLVGIGTTNATDKLTVRGGDISVGVSTSQGLILTSPNGTRFRLIVANDGTLSTVAV